MLKTYIGRILWQIMNYSRKKLYCMKVQLHAKRTKGNLLMTLTSQKLIFEKEKGLFKKERELVDIILLESVKFYNDAAQIKHKDLKSKSRQ